ncbi:MAG: hypothetical protein L0Z54_00760 [Thermoplasmata archaeon]|nr:hypothetical protein [Thermoplasmata archaeon]
MGAWAAARPEAGIGRRAGAHETPNIDIRREPGWTCSRDGSLGIEAGDTPPHGGSDIPPK